ncbi:MAG: tetratricopeptide repeat protein [Candidatus Symbiothrix sp.]|jgi:tetratricopeptide (TPR) repeat protein|nr:tetratricopeptide repeat protein [Candidatus Symbiothrix sp.]
MDIEKNIKENLAEAQYYVSFIQSRADFFQSEDVEELVDRQLSIFGACIRTKVAFQEFLSNAYDIPYEGCDSYSQFLERVKIEFGEESKSAEISEILRNINQLTCHPEKVARSFPIEDLRENLNQVHQIASALPRLLNAVDAGEDEDKVQTVDINQEEETLSQAVRRLSAEIKKTSDNKELAELYFELGEIYYEYKQWNNAESSFSKAIELIPNRPKIQFTEDGDMIMGGQTYSDLQLAKYHGYRGTVRVIINQEEEAISDFKIAVENDRNNDEYWGCLGSAYLGMENYPDAIRALNNAIAINPYDIVSLKQRANSYFALDDFQNALNDYNKVIDMYEEDDENNEEIKNSIRECCCKIQENQTLEERIASYLEIINLLKSDPELTFSLVEDYYREFRPNTISATEYYAHKKTTNELFATICLLEEYKLIEKFFCEYGRENINDTLLSEFAWFQPTVLYFITCKKASAMIKDLPKMIRFLIENGADPNIPAADGSTMLWNQTNDCYTDTEIMQLLLELGANPNIASYDDNLGDIYPLQNCLIGVCGDDYDEEKDNWRPYTQANIEKAKLLLEYGADPNLASPFMSNLPPLMLAIVYGKDNDGKDNENNILPLIDLLLEKGANPNFVDDEGYTPLQAAADNNLPKVMQLLALEKPNLPVSQELNETEKQ